MCPSRRVRGVTRGGAGFDLHIGAESRGLEAGGGRAKLRERPGAPTGEFGRWISPLVMSISSHRPTLERISGAVNYRFVAERETAGETAAQRLKERSMISPS